MNERRRAGLTFIDRLMHLDDCEHVLERVYESWTTSLTSPAAMRSSRPRHARPGLDSIDAEEAVSRCSSCCGGEVVPSHFEPRS